MRLSDAVKIIEVIRENSESKLTRIIDAALVSTESLYVTLNLMFNKADVKFTQTQIAENGVSRSRDDDDNIAKAILYMFDNCPHEGAPKIAAIKFYRHMTNAGLLESKNAVEEIGREYMRHGLM